MDNKPTIQEQNNQVIENFFLSYGDETKEKMTSFLLEMSLLTITDQVELPMTEQGAGTVVTTFRMLHDLVTGLQNPSAKRIQPIEELRSSVAEQMAGLKRF